MMPRPIDYAPLSLRPSKAELAEYRRPREVFGYDASTGFDEQKAPMSKKGLFGQPTNNDVWERRYRLNAFAEANGMTYTFHANPAHWPGKSKKATTLTDVLIGSGADGQRVMTCFEEDVKAQGAISGRDVEFNEFLVVALELGVRTPTVFLTHRRRPADKAADLLQANYTVGDLFARHWATIDGRPQYEAARPYLTDQVLGVILRVALGYDLHLSGGWLYLMKPDRSASAGKKNFVPQLVRERFEIAAAVGPSIAEAARDASRAQA